MSRTRKSVWNLVSGLGFTLATMALGIVATPLLLRWLGAERFGLARVLADWIAYLPLLDFGLNGALMARLAVASGQEDKLQVERLLAAGARYGLGVAAVMLAVSAFFGYTLPHLLVTVTVAARELRWAWFILVLAVFYYPLSCLGSLLEAQQKRYIVNFLYTLQSLLTTGFMLLLASWGWGLYGQSAALVAGQLPVWGYLVWHAKKRYQINWRAAPEAETSSSLWGLNRPVFLYNLGARLGMLSDNIVISLILGPVAVAPFFLTQRLANLAQNQFLSIGNSTWAGLVDLQAKGETGKFYERLRELTGLVSSVSVAALIPIAVYNRHFVALWVGLENYAGTWVTLLVCLNVWLWGVLYLWGWVLQGTGLMSDWTPYALLFLVINLAVSISGTYLLGMAGPLLGTAAGLVLVKSWAMPYLFRKKFKWLPLSLWQKALWPLVWGLPFGGLVWWAARNRTIENWFQLFLEVSLTGLGGLALWVVAGMTAHERQAWRTRLQTAWQG